MVNHVLIRKWHSVLMTANNCSGGRSISYWKVLEDKMKSLNWIDGEVNSCWLLSYPVRSLKSRCVRTFLNTWAALYIVLHVCTQLFERRKAKQHLLQRKCHFPSILSLSAVKYHNFSVALVFALCVCLTFLYLLLQQLRHFPSAFLLNPEHFAMWKLGPWHSVFEDLNVILLVFLKVDSYNTVHLTCSFFIALRNETTALFNLACSLARYMKLKTSVVNAVVSIFLYLLC